MLIKLFNSIKNYGKFVRNKKLDGLEYWKKIKNILQQGHF